MLAIIIPYYKLTFFKETLDSLAAQTNQNFKVYIGDDASPENPLPLLDNYQDMFDFEYHRFEENLGGISLTQQWERCIALSGNEEWIMILGDDDVLGENVVQEFYNNVKEVNEKLIKVIRFSTYKINEVDEKITDLYQHPKIETSKDFFFRRKSRSSISEYVFNREVYIKVRFKNFPLGWYSDCLAVLEFSNFGNVYSINEAFVKIRISSYSISGSNFFIFQKEKARVAFYSYLINKKAKFFNKAEIKELFWMLIKTYLNNKKNIYFLFKISNVYLKSKLMIMFIVNVK